MGTMEIEEFKEFKTTGAWPNFDILMTYIIFFFILTFLFLHFLILELLFFWFLLLNTTLVNVHALVCVVLSHDRKLIDILLVYYQNRCFIFCGYFSIICIFFLFQIQVHVIFSLKHQIKHGFYTHDMVQILLNLEY